MDSLFGKQTKVGDIRTPEQKAAQALLQQLAMTGSGGGITLGTPYTGSLGDFNMTAGTASANANLASLFNNQDIQNARKTFTNLADTTFDPSDPRSGYAAYSRELAKAQGESSSVLDREAAISGSRFGTGILKNKQDLATTFANQRETALASLFQNARSSQLAGAQGLQELNTKQGTLAQTIAQQEDIVRQLKNQEAQAKYDEFKRQRGETLGRIDLLTTEASRNPLLGITQYGESSPWSGLVNSVLGAAGTAIGGPIGGMIGDSLSSLFSNVFNKNKTTTNGSAGNILNSFNSSGLSLI